MSAHEPRQAGGAGKAPLRLDEHVCFALYSASALVTRLYRPLLDPLGLTYPQYLAMLALWEAAPRTVGELGDALGLDSATLTPLLKRLEASGFVSRSRDPADERRVLVSPTVAGLALREKAAGVPQAMACQLPIGVDEIVALRTALRGLVDGLRAGKE